MSRRDGETDARGGGRRTDTNSHIIYDMRPDAALRACRTTYRPLLQVPAANFFEGL